MNLKCVSINDLNEDCLVHIFKFLPAPDKVVAELVCQDWRNMMKIAWKQYHRLDTADGDIFCLNNSDDIVDLSLLQKILPKFSSCLNEFNLTWAQNPRKWTVMEWEDRDHKCFPLGKNLSSIGSLLQTCHHIQILRLCRCVVDFKAEILSKLFALNSSLKVVELVDYSLDASCLLNLNFECLESLFMFSCTVFDINFFDSIEFECENLKIFSLPKTEIIGSSKFSLALPPSLEQLDISTDTNISRHEFGRITGKLRTNSLPNLKVLRVADNPKLTDGILRIIAEHCPTLSAIDISDCANITSGGLHSLASMPKLICLIADRCPKLSGESFQNLNANLKILSVWRYRFTLLEFSSILSRLNNLEILSLGDDCMTNDYLKAAVSIIKMRTNSVRLSARFMPTSVEAEKIVNDCSLFTFTIDTNNLDSNYYHYLFE